MPLSGIATDVTEFDRIRTVYEKDGVKVIAYEVDHGDLIKPCYGYRFEYGGRVAVLSSDTRYNPNVIKYGAGADLLVHEVASAAPELMLEAYVQKIVAHHTTLREAGRVFAQKSQTGRKGPDQCEMTDPAISSFRGNSAMGVDLRCHSATVSWTYQAIAPRGDQQRGHFLTGDERDRLRFCPVGAAENGAQRAALDWQEIVRAGWTGSSAWALEARNIGAPAAVRWK